MLLLLPAVAFAEPGEVVGRVVDLGSGAPVAGAYVRAAPPAAGPGEILALVQTAEDGTFKLGGLGQNPVDLVIGASGYTGTTLRAIVPGGSRAVVVRLLPALAEAGAQEITIEATRERIDKSPTISSHRLEKGAVDKTPGSLEDVTRAISLKPGIIQISEFAPVLFVRGGDAYQTYFFLDDVLIYNPFQPVGGGTIFNHDLVQAAEVYTGGQLASFPEALSGLISIQYKEPEEDRIRGLAEASIISVNSRIEGGIDKSAGGWRNLAPDGWLLSARRSDYEPALWIYGPVLGNDEIATPYFLDLFAKGTWRLSPRDRVSANAMWVQNSLKGFEYVDEESGREDRIFFDDQQAIAWLRWTRVLGESTLLKTSFSRVADRLRASSTGTDPLAVDVDSWNWSVRMDLAHSPEAGTAWDAGLYLNNAWIKILGTTPDFRRLQPGVAIGGDINIPLADLFPERGFAIGGAYLQYKRTLSDRVTIQPGVRVSWNDATHETNVGPRLNASWKVHERHVLKAAWGIFHQPPINPVLLDPEFGNPNLRSERAIHWVAGWEGEPLPLDPTWMKAEVYFKDIYDQIMPQDFSTVNFENPDSDDLEKLRNPFLNRGQSDAWGFELSMRRAVSDRVRVEANYSYLEVETLNPLIVDPRNRRFPPFQDQTHTANVVTNWKATDRWTFSVTGRFGSGKPFTAVESFRVENDTSNDLGPRNIWVPDELGALNDSRYPSYGRVDVRMERRWKWRSAGVTAYLEILNAQIRRNVEFIGYTAGDPDGQPPTAPERKDVLGLPTIPFMGIRVQW